MDIQRVSKGTTLDLSFKVGIEIDNQCGPEIEVSVMESEMDSDGSKAFMVQVRYAEVGGKRKVYPLIQEVGSEDQSLSDMDSLPVVSSPIVSSPVASSLGNPTRMMLARADGLIAKFKASKQAKLARKMTPETQLDSVPETQL